MSAIDQAMQTLTAQWYNAMCTGLNLSPGNFQLTQGSNASVNTSATYDKYKEAAKFYHEFIQK